MGKPMLAQMLRFILDVCRLLKERKSYLVWAAVGGLGLSALGDLVTEMHLEETLPLLSVLWPFLSELRIELFDFSYWLRQIKVVEAIQACGGQKPADDRRFQTGGGILWSVLKVRDPNFYIEIMRRGKEFEKQFKPQNINQEAMHNKEDAYKNTAKVTEDSYLDNQLKQNTGEQKHVSVHDRVRIPVAYGDLLEGENPGVE